MRFLIVGCGSIGKRHIRNLISLGYSNIIAYDIDVRTLESIRNKFHVKTSRMFESILVDSDVVFVCTPNHLQTKFALRSLEEGKHVFVEKPLAHTLLGMDRMENLIQEKKNVFQVGYNLRFHPIIRRAKEIVDSTKLGKIYSIDPLTNCLVCAILFNNKGVMYL